jgi:hypothetical protein
MNMPPDIGFDPLIHEKTTIRFFIRCHSNLLGGIGSSSAVMMFLLGYRFSTRCQDVLRGGLLKALRTFVENVTVLNEDGTVLLKSR